MNSMLTNLNSVGVRRNKRWLVRDFDMTIRRGEIVSLIGPNGGGKTTVAKIVAGALLPDVGSVEKAKGIRVGYVPQRVHIESTLPMTVRRLMKLSQNKKRSEIDAMLSLLEIQNLADSPVQRLSGGEFQRALLARALLRKPDLLILDEPSTGLDFSGEADLYNNIVDVRDTFNCGILLASHDLHIVLAKSDTVVCLNVHICCTGKPKQIIGEEEFIKLFGDEAAQSHAFYPHQHDHSHNLDGSISVS